MQEDEKFSLIISIKSYMKNKICIYCLADDLLKSCSSKQLLPVVVKFVFFK